MGRDEEKTDLVGMRRDAGDELRRERRRGVERGRGGQRTSAGTQPWREEKGMVGDGCEEDALDAERRLCGEWTRG